MALSSIGEEEADTKEGEEVATKEGEGVATKGDVVAAATAADSKRGKSKRQQTTASMRRKCA